MTTAKPQRRRDSLRVARGRIGRTDSGAAAGPRGAITCEAMVETAATRLREAVHVPKGKRVRMVVPNQPTQVGFRISGLCPVDGTGACALPEADHDGSVSAL